MQLRGGDAQTNAEIIREVLSGERRDEARNLIIVNAAAALFVGGKASNLREGATLAALSVDSGAAMDKLERLAWSTSAASEGQG